MKKIIFHFFLYIFSKLFDSMFEDIAWFFIILISSIIISNLIFRRDTGPFNSIMMGLAYIGVIVHELCHFAMSLVAGIVPRGINVKYRSEKTGMPNPHGSVNIGPQRNFLQAFLICLAPLYISTWLIFWSLTIAFDSVHAPLIRISAGFFCFSLFIGAAPSNTDFKILFKAFQDNPSHSMYQISLVFLSILLNWMILSFYQITFMLDVYYYMVIVITYYILKYGIIGINKTISIMRLKYLLGSTRLDHNHYTHRSYNPFKHHKIKIKEAQW